MTTTTTKRRHAIPINRDVLRWARERMGASYNDIAEESGFKPNQVEAWESGQKTPTVKQARRLASVYDRPFLEFFSKERPKVKEPDLVPDFRMHREAEEPREHFSLVQIQTEAEEIRLNALDLFEMLGDKPTEIPAAIYSSLSVNSEIAASRVRDTLNFPIEEQTQRKSNERYKFVNAFRRAIERSGIIVAKNSGLAEFEARGMCLYAPVLPVIVYSTESPSAQAFTLAHELGHVSLKQSGISGPPGAQEKTEEWCDNFAAAFLVPSAELEKFKAKPDRPAPAIDDYDLHQLAWRFCISQHAMLIRLVALRYVEARYYWEVKRSHFIEQEKQYKSPPMRPKYYGSRYRTARGDLYTGLVLEAWSNGEITNHNAAEFMGIKNLAHLDAIRDRYEPE